MSPQRIQIHIPGPETFTCPFGPETFTCPFEKGLHPASRRRICHRLLPLPGETHPPVAS